MTFRGEIKFQNSAICAQQSTQCGPIAQKLGLPHEPKQPINASARHQARVDKAGETHLAGSNNACAAERLSTLAAVSRGKLCGAQSRSIGTRTTLNREKRRQPAKIWRTNKRRSRACGGERLLLLLRTARTRCKIISSWRR